MKENKCEYCDGDGTIEVLGDGENFEVDVIDHKVCSHCQGLGYENGTETQD